MNYFFEYCDNHKQKTQDIFGDMFWDYVVNLKYMKLFYQSCVELETIKVFLKKEYHTESEIYVMKNIMQNDYRTGNWIEKKEKQIDKYKNRVFDFLNTVDNPYNYIFTPIWFQKTIMQEKGFSFYKESISGINEVTMFVAGEYSKSKLKYYA